MVDSVADNTYPSTLTSERNASMSALMAVISAGREPRGPLLVARIGVAGLAFEEMEDSIGLLSSPCWLEPGRPAPEGNPKYCITINGLKSRYIFKRDVDETCSVSMQLKMHKVIVDRIWQDPVCISSPKQRTSVFVENKKQDMALLIVKEEPFSSLSRDITIF